MNIELEDKIKCDILPHFVIEIVSPSQSIHELMLKANKFIKAGIPVVWTIEPYGNLIYISTLQGRKVKLAGMLESEGTIVDFAKIFLKIANLCKSANVANHLTPSMTFMLVILLNLRIGKEQC